MTLSFPYLNRGNAAAAATATAADVSQEDSDVAMGTVNGDDAIDAAGGIYAEEQFDEEADAREFVFPNLEQDIEPVAPVTLARTRGAQRLLQNHPLLGTPTPERTGTPATPTPGDTNDRRTSPAPRRVDFNTQMAAPRESVTAAPGMEQHDSALTQACVNNSNIRSLEELYEFLEWQSSRKESPQEQARFKEDAMGYPGLLVFAMMRPKVPYIQLIHSIQVYPNAPGSDPTWKGKTIGFLGDRTSYSPAPQMVELKEKVPWAWESRLVVNDLTALDHFYVVPGNSNVLWTPDPTTARMTVTAPKMLALPPDCVALCAAEPRTPYGLATHLQSTLGAGHLNASKYAPMLDWCLMASQAEPATGDSPKSSLLSFPITPIIGSVALHKWATARLAFTLGPPTGSSQAAHSTTPGSEHRAEPNASQAPTPPQLDVSLIAQVTAAVMAALRANNGSIGGAIEDGTSKQADESKQYSTFQLAKLKGFCGIIHNSDIPPIWNYFRSTKDVDAHRTKLLECMGQWAKENEITITRGLYFEKSTMDEITKMEFNPGSATAYFPTAEKGISILIVRPRQGHETAELRSKEHAMLLTERNYTLTDALGLSRKDPRPPASTYLELVRDVGTFCALVRTLFGDSCDYFQNLFDLWQMLNSEQVYAKSERFGVAMVRQITWAIIEDSRQFFFRTMTEEELARGQPRFPTSYLMNIIGTDVFKAVEIRLGNFPEKWKVETVHTQEARGTSMGQGRQTPHLVNNTSRTWGTGSLITPQPVPSTGPERPVLIRQEDVHPTIKSLMEDYIRHFRSVQLRVLCKAAGITETDLPTEARYLRNGKNMLCYSYVLGKCNGKYCGRASEGHVAAGELSTEFVNRLCALLRPGVEARKATEPAAQASNYFPGQKRKRTA
jgi:hypothetical protein